MTGGEEKAPGSGLFSTPGRPGSIVGAEAFHFRVRDGNGWCHLALATRERFQLLVLSFQLQGRPSLGAPVGVLGSGGGTRTHDLRVMSPASCRCSTPRRVSEQREYT